MLLGINYVSMIKQLNGYYQSVQKLSLTRNVIAPGGNI